MKKTISLITALLITASSFACHYTATGFCGDSTYFQSGLFNNDMYVEIRYQGTTAIIDSFLTPKTGNANQLTAIHWPFNSKTVTIEWRYKTGTGNFGGWIQNTSSLKNLCTVTPVSLSNLTGTLKDNILTTSFVAGAKPIDHYNIQVSNDSINWQTVDREDHAGTFTINLAGKAIAGIGLIGLGFIGFKKKRLIWLAMASLYCIFYVSCQKEIIKSDKTISYKYMRVQEVGTDAVIQNSNVVKL